MIKLGDSVGVITGAASGIGLALAKALAQAGAKVVLADVERRPLDEAVTASGKDGFDVRGHVTDVANVDSVQELANQTFATFGKVNILCNNAGVGTLLTTPIWETTINDWSWFLNVNLWGVVHGIRAFIPRMLASGEEGYVVNTASVAGLLPGARIYSVTKHAVVALTEYLDASLRGANANIQCSVFCPGFVRTNITTSRRNRPPELRDGQAKESEKELNAIAYMRRMAEEKGMSAEQAASLVLDGIRNRQFWIFTDRHFEVDIRARIDALCASMPRG